MDKRLAIALAVLLLFAIGFTIWRSRPADRAVADTADEVVRVERGPLRLDVNATGSVSLRTRVDLSFKTSGLLDELLVDEGQRVSAGQVLARLETQDLEQAVLQAQASLASAEAQLAKARAGARVEEVAAAEANLAMAQAGVKGAEAALGAALGGVAAAQATLDSSRAALTKLIAGPTELDLQIAEKQVELAQNQLWGLQGQRDALGGPGGTSAQLEAAEGQVAAGESQVEIARMQLAALKAGPRAEDIAVAKAQVAQAEAGLQTAQAQVAQAQAQVDSARAQAQQAEAQLALLKAGTRSEDVAAAEAQVAQAEALLGQAQSALGDATLIAPIDGVVAIVDIGLKELVTAGKPVVTLADNSRFYITVNVDEADIGRIVEGQNVEVTLDAYPSAVLQGTITHISPVSKMEGGIVSYLTRVEIASSPVPLREGLTANAAIVTKRVEDAILVPNSAISIDPDTNLRYVGRMVGDQIEVIQVTLGLQTDLVSEVTSGLQEGDVVLVRGTSYRDQFRQMMESTFKQR